LADTNIAKTRIAKTKMHAIAKLKENCMDLKRFFKGKSPVNDYS